MGDVSKVSSSPITFTSLRPAAMADEQSAKVPEPDVKRARSSETLVEAVTAARTESDADEEEVDSCFECTLCLQLFLDAVTTPCGHSFCSTCLASALRRRSACPLCRRAMHTHAPPATVVLNEYIRKMYPKALEKRRNEQLQREESTADTPRTNDGPRTVGLFVMETVLPGQSLQLHIFEPRYRLLVRRALERDNKIGLAAASSHNGVYTYFCEANIVNSQMIPDGRYLIHLVGERPMRILSSSTDEAGYKVAEAELVEDGDEYDDVEQRVREKCSTLWQQMRTTHGDSLLFREFRDEVGGDIPLGSTELSWWACRCLSVLGFVDGDTKQQMLSSSMKHRYELVERLFWDVEARGGLERLVGSSSGVSMVAGGGGPRGGCALM